MPRSNPLLRCASLLLSSGCAGALFGCAGASPPAATPRELPASQLEPAHEPPSTMVVSGLRGTLSQPEIQNALEPKLPKLLRCVQQRLSTLEVLSGTVTFAFQVATNGHVVAVSPSSSTLGDRDAERCMLEVAARTRFPPPHGGDAEFTWPLEVPIDPEVRPPVELPSELSRDALGPQLEELSARCGGGPVVVTAYVEPEGRVLSAGVAAPGSASAGQLDCISEGVRALAFPSPGSYLGKTRFTIP